jgi:hypothetical protein
MAPSYVAYMVSRVQAAYSICTVNVYSSQQMCSIEYTCTVLCCVWQSLIVASHLLSMVQKQLYWALCMVILLYTLALPVSSWTRAMTQSLVRRTACGVPNYLYAHRKVIICKQQPIDNFCYNMSHSIFAMS